MSDQSKSSLTAHYLLEVCGVNDRTSYYAGRGATRSDVSGKILIQMYTMIRDRVGQQAADDFNRLIHSIKSLTAVNLILTIHRFEKNGWKFEQEILKGHNGVFSDAQSHEEIIGGFLGAMMAMSQFEGSQDKTYSIINDFDHELKVFLTSNQE